MEPGTVIFDGRPIENTVYELFSLVVPVEYRRSGVARKLCEVALDKANQDKADVYLGKHKGLLINYLIEGIIWTIALARFNDFGISWAA